MKHVLYVCDICRSDRTSIDLVEIYVDVAYKLQLQCIDSETCKVHICKSCLRQLVDLSPMELELEKEG